MDTDVQTSEFQGVPHITNVGKGNRSTEFPACVLSIDIRRSTAILDEHHRPTAVKIYKAFHEVTCRVVERFDGRVRSFDGDGILALWHAPYRADIERATKAAIVIKDLLRGKAGTAIGKYRDVDFGIGLDHGDVHAARVGSGSDSATRDLVWLGHAVTFAVRLSNGAESPQSVWVSDKVYQNLDDDWKYENPDALFITGSKWKERWKEYQGDDRTVHQLKDKYRCLQM